MAVHHGGRGPSRAGALFHGALARPARRAANRLRLPATMAVAGLAGLAHLAWPGMLLAAEADPHLDLTLESSIVLALANNRTLLNAHLNRQAERFALQVAENKFVPHLEVGSFVERENSRNQVERSTVGGVSSKLTLNIPTGGRFALGWSGFEKHLPNVRQNRRYGSAMTLTFTQPLLRHAGFEVSAASVDIAQVSEKINRLALQKTVMDVVTSVIRRYRAYQQARLALEISDKSLERAEALLEVNTLLVRAGRMAAQEVVQTRANIASRELDVIAAQNRLDQARLNLIDILDIDSHTRVTPQDELEVSKPDENRDWRAIAQQHRPDYQIAKLSLQNAETRARVADNNRLWDLSLQLSANLGHEDRDFRDAIGALDRDDYEVRLDLSIPFGAAHDPRELEYIQASVNLHKVKNSLMETRQRVDIEVHNATREVSLSYRQVGLARMALDLVEEKLEVEREKLRLGLSSNFQLVSFEDDIVAVQHRELGATIDYLNALTELDRTLGTTLRTWDIRIEGAGAGDDS